MKIDILTLFPGMFASVFGESIVKRALENGLLTINYHDIRAFAHNKHHRVDDYPFGGGEGMLMQVEPIDLAIESVKSPAAKIIYLSPKGATLTQGKLKSYAEEGHLILLCGHYEGLDERILEKHEIQEISIGDYVLTGGEIPAMVLVDGITRLLPGALPKEASFQNESHYDGLLEHPQYTRPRAYQGMCVPDVLLSGHHLQIEEWKFIQSVKKTQAVRPDLLKLKNWTAEEKKILKKHGLKMELKAEK